MKKYWSGNMQNMKMPWKCYQQHQLVAGNLPSVDDGLLEATNTWGPSIVNSTQLKNYPPRGIGAPCFPDK